MTGRVTLPRAVCAVLAVIVVGVVAACSGDGNGGSGGAGGGNTRGGREIHAVQIGAFSDSGPARRLADSLSMAGWQAYVGRATDEALYRVRLSPSSSSVLTEKVAFALRADSIDAIAVVDTAPIEPLVEAIRVNRGSHGMTSRVRWLVAPHGRSLLVVHDPASSEGDALPDGFVFASERDGYVLQKDSVWDVAPSPSWNRIAYGQAFVISVPEGSSDSVMAAMWAHVANAAAVPEDTLRAYAYLISGMATINAYARPVVVQLDAVDSTTGSPAPRSQPLLVSGGWRVRWTPDTTVLGIGDAPSMVQDDSPPRNWMTVDLATGEVRGTISQSRLVPLDWRLGPALDVSVPIDLQTARPLRLEGASISSAAGWIRRDGKVVGPGVALAATRDGRFIAALAPRVDAKDYESPLEPVVYRVSR